MWRGAWGVGAIHHIAVRVDDDAHQLEVRRQVAEVSQPTPVIDRFWFRSVYFKEPGGVLFELATDGPGFAVDEDPQHLGESLVLPPWLEPQRDAIEQVPLQVREVSVRISSGRHPLVYLYEMYSAPRNIFACQRAQHHPRSAPATDSHDEPVAGRHRRAGFRSYESGALFGDRIGIHKNFNLHESL